MQERVSSRVRAFLQGRAVFNNGFASLDCTVRDISETGARLEMASSVTLPDQFDLHIPKKGVTHRARIVWRRDVEVGVTLQEDLEARPAEQGGLERNPITWDRTRPRRSSWRIRRR